jgi:hypothetical protein
VYFVFVRFLYNVQFLIGFIWFSLLSTDVCLQFHKFDYCFVHSKCILCNCSLLFFMYTYFSSSLNYYLMAAFVVFLMYMYITEMFTSFKACTVQIIYILWFGSCNCSFEPASFDLKILNILHQTMVYAASVHTGLDPL